MNEIIDQVLLKQYGEGDYAIQCGTGYQKRLFKKLMLEVLDRAGITPEWELKAIPA